MGLHMPLGNVRIRNPEKGFTFVAVLGAMFLLALGSQAVMQYVSQHAQRDREVELLQIGQEFAAAIGSYYESSPGTLKRWPQSLNDLTDDKRFVGVRRHLRQVYIDPMTRTPEWGLSLSNDGGITGVHSLSADAPIRSGSIELANLRLDAASRYFDWKFSYIPPFSPSAKPASAQTP